MNRLEETRENLQTLIDKYNGELNEFQNQKSVICDQIEDVESALHLLAKGLDTQIKGTSSETRG